MPEGILIYCAHQGQNASIIFVRHSEVKKNFFLKHYVPNKSMYLTNTIIFEMYWMKFFQNTLLNIHKRLLLQ